MAAHAFNILSLCTGGGGLDLGVGLAVPNARTVCMVEREAFAVAHLVEKMRAGLLDEAPVWSDARTFNGRPWRGVVDCVIGGIPCQPHSQAGKRLGREDERDLWSPARRIIVQTGARFVLIENVEGMLSTGGAERVVRDLERLGFIVEIGLFSAREVGASHLRKRVFILGYRPGRGVGLADAYRPRSQGQWGSDHAEGREDALGHAGLGGGAVLEHPASQRRGERRPEPELFGGRCSTAFASGDLVNPARHGGGLHPGPWPEGIGAPDAGGRGADVGHSERGGHAGRTDGAERSSIERASAERSERRGLPLAPPGPGDTEGWRAVLARAPELEPAISATAAQSLFHGMADGLAHRVDRLRMCGNGVHPLAAAYAWRTLAARIARRCAGSAEHVLIGEAA